MHVRPVKDLCVAHGYHVVHRSWEANYLRVLVVISFSWYHTLTVQLTTSKINQDSDGISAKAYQNRRNTKPASVARGQTAKVCSFNHDKYSWRSLLVLSTVVS
jgi:hypothetical protein